MIKFILLHNCFCLQADQTDEMKPKALKEIMIVVIFAALTCVGPKEVDRHSKLGKSVS